jgi:hypothetical protein
MTRLKAIEMTSILFWLIDRGKSLDLISGNRCGNRPTQAKNGLNGPDAFFFSATILNPHLTYGEGS